MAPLKKVESLYLKARRTLMQTLDVTNNTKNNDDTLRQYFDCIPSIINDDIMNMINLDPKFDNPTGHQIASAFSNASSQNATFIGSFRQILGMCSLKSI